MGINILVVTVDEMNRQADINRRFETASEDEARQFDFVEHYHPDWNANRTSGDRDFADLAATLPQQSMAIGGETIFRPVDILAWRRAVDASDLPDKARFHHLLDIVEQDLTQHILLSW